MMKIGIEAERANLEKPTGVEKYASELILNLAKLDKSNEYTLYFRTEPLEKFKRLPPNFKIKVIPFPKFWTQTRLALELILHPVDVFLLPIQALPFFHPRRSIITVHDIAYEFFPEAFGGFMRFYLKLTTRFGVKYAKKIITVSESTKNDVAKVYGVSKEKIHTIHLGLDSDFIPRSYEQVQPELDKYDLVYQKYILFVGTVQPRKNIPNLLDAFLKIKKDNHIEEKLVIVGGRGWLSEPIIKKIKIAALDGSVRYLDYVPGGDLPYLYSGAKLLTLPALYEGFGLPPLEAIASGVPVVVSNVSSLPEIAGEAGVLVDPNSADSIAEGILKVLTDANLRQNIIDKGLQRAKLFTWENTARKTLELIESLK